MWTEFYKILSVNVTNVILFLTYFIEAESLLRIYAYISERNGCFYLREEQANTVLLWQLCDIYINIYRVFHDFRA